METLTFKKRITINFSDYFSGSKDNHEETCQVMLAVGEEWLKNKPLSIWEWKKEKELGYWHGRLKNRPLEELRKTFFEGLKKALNSDDITWSQADTVIGHLCFIHKYGRRTWLKVLKKHMSSDEFYEWPTKGSKLLRN